MATRNRNTSPDVKLFDTLIETLDLAASQGYPMVAQTYSAWAEQHDAPKFGAPLKAQEFHGQFIAHCRKSARDDLVKKWEETGSQKTRFKQVATVGAYYDDFAAATLRATQSQRKERGLDDKKLNVSAVRQTALKDVLKAAEASDATPDSILKAIKSIPASAAKAEAEKVIGKIEKGDRFSAGLRAVKAYNALNVLIHGSKSEAPVTVFDGDEEHGVMGLMRQCMIGLTAVALANGLEIKDGKLDSADLKSIGDTGIASARKAYKGMVVSAEKPEPGDDDDDDDDDTQVVVEKAIASKKPAKAKAKAEPGDGIDMEALSAAITEASTQAAQAVLSQFLRK